MDDVTCILDGLRQLNGQAVDELLPLVYDELRRLAAQRLSREPPGQTLQATALVHEAYIRLLGDEPRDWDNRGHFFVAASEAMRRILVDNARRKRSQRRGGGCQRVALDHVEVRSGKLPEDLIELDDALSKLTEQDPDVAEIVKLRYFGGLTLAQAAKVKGISSRTAGRYWHYARLWLYRQVTAEDRSAL
jgi:RNA polymerase sigma factor (TIGR02999 family)